jgi:NADH-quinone oxidoreductase subunit C
MNRITLPECAALIRQRLGQDAVIVEEMKNDDIMVVVDKDRIVAAAGLLKNDPELRFSTLMNHLGVDYGDRMAVIYNLYSTELRRKLTLKAYLDRAVPEVETLRHVFRGVDWFERETFDLFGIRFSGHVNLKRLLLPEDWEGFPLRKDYVYPESYRGIATGRTDLLDDGEVAPV